MTKVGSLRYCKYLLPCNLKFRLSANVHRNVHRARTGDDEAVARVAVVVGRDTPDVVLTEVEVFDRTLLLLAVVVEDALAVVVAEEEALAVVEEALAAELALVMGAL